MVRNKSYVGFLIFRPSFAKILLTLPSQAFFNIHGEQLESLPENLPCPRIPKNRNHLVENVLYFEPRNFIVKRFLAKN